MTSRRKTVIMSIMIWCVGIAAVACTPQESSGGMEIHFCHLTDCEKEFMMLISNAEEVACAFYDIDDPALITSLQATRASIIIDEDAPPIASAKSRKGEGIMHHKFCVINRSVVITGSYNPVRASADDYNNIIIIHAKTIAQHYLEVHAQLTHTHRRSSHTRFIHDGKRIEAYACPQDDCQRRLLEQLRAAETSISFALFTFTDPDVAATLIERYRQGVNVTGVVESYQSSTYGQYSTLRAAGIPVVLERSGKLQHNNVFVIDNDTVITGSYNPTKAAYSVNDEDLLVIHDAAVAAVYTMVIGAISRDAATQSFK